MTHNKLSIFKKLHQSFKVNRLSDGVFTFTWISKSHLTVIQSFIPLLNATTYPENTLRYTLL